MQRVDLISVVIACIGFVIDEVADRPALDRYLLMNTHPCMQGYLYLSLYQIVVMGHW